MYFHLLNIVLDGDVKGRVLVFAGCDPLALLLRWGWFFLGPLLSLFIQVIGILLGEAELQHLLEELVCQGNGHGGQVDFKVLLDGNPTHRRLFPTEHPQGPLWIKYNVDL